MTRHSHLSGPTPATSLARNVVVQPPGCARPAPVRTPQVVTALLALSLILLAAPVLGAQASPADPGPRPERVVVVPVYAHPGVSDAAAERITRNLRDAVRQLRPGRMVEALTVDRSLPSGPEEAGEHPDLVRIRRADSLRLEATRLMLDGRAPAAYGTLLAAIRLYEESMPNLADFSKLSDAYCGAAVAAWQAHKGIAQVKALLRDAMALRPNATVDRRLSNAKLNAVERYLRDYVLLLPRKRVEVVGPAVAATVFVNGERIGSLPGASVSLPPGQHFVQVRGEGFESEAHAVQVGDSAVRLEVNPRPAAPGTSVATQPHRLPASEEITRCAVGRTFARHACQTQIGAFARQAGAQLVLMAEAMTDEAGHIVLHTFTVRPSTGSVVSNQPLRLSADLGDLSGGLRGMGADLLASRPDPWTGARAKLELAGR